jgi:hypothetical protein
MIPRIDSDMINDIWYFVGMMFVFGAPILLIGLAIELIPPVIETLKESIKPSTSKRRRDDEDEEDYYYY